MMVTKRKVRPIRREFTPGTAQCVVVTIRAVFDLKNFTSGDGDVYTIENLLDEARCCGAAEVIEHMTIVEDFDKAADILKTQRVPFK